jgi:hypothetical protein
VEGVLFVDFQVASMGISCWGGGGGALVYIMAGANPSAVRSWYGVRLRISPGYWTTPLSRLLGLSVYLWFLRNPINRSNQLDRNESVKGSSGNSLRPLAGRNSAPPAWARCWAGPLTWR